VLAELEAVLLVTVVMTCWPLASFLIHRNGSKRALKQVPKPL